MARRLGPLVLVALAISIAGREAPGGILIADPSAYDTHSRLLFGSLFRAIASDIAATASSAARVLEVVCGPGHLSIRLARDHGLDVTGLDLDPEMIERARANATGAATTDGAAPEFLIGDVAARRARSRPASQPRRVVP